MPSSETPTLSIVKRWKSPIRQPSAQWSRNASFVSSSVLAAIGPEGLQKLNLSWEDVAIIYIYVKFVYICRMKKNTTLEMVAQSDKVSLYCLRLSDRILIIGNGGIKESRTYQEEKKSAVLMKWCSVYDLR